MRAPLTLIIPALLAASCIDGMSESRRPCPCAPGWTCCADAEICVRDPEDCPVVEGCDDTCIEGERQCQGNATRVCEFSEAMGCTRWSSPSSCGDGEFCLDGECRCLDQCSPGSALCTATPGYQACELQASGCHDWSDEVACDAGWTCSQGRCVRGCIDQCSPSERWCDGSEGVETCRLDADDGCYDWSETEPCAVDQVCRKGICLSRTCVEGTNTPGPEVCDRADNDCDGLVDEPELTRLGDLFLGGQLKDIALDGDVAYLANGYGLVAYDISQPASPALLGRLPTPGYANGIAVDSDFAYVSDAGTPNGVHIIDISAPALPVAVGFIAVDWQRARSIDVSDGLLVTAYYGVAQVFDVSDPTAPVEIGSVELPESVPGVIDHHVLVSDVEIRGDAVYLAGGTMTLTLDISDPTDPKLAHELLLRSSTIALDGDHAYLGDYINGLYILDLSDPLAPLEVGSLSVDPDSVIRLVHASDGHVLLANHNALVAIDVRDPTAPREVGRMIAGELYGGPLAVRGEHAIVAAAAYNTDRSYLSVVDISDLTGMRRVGHTSEARRIKSMAADGDRAVITEQRWDGDEYDESHTLHVIDASEPDSPALLGSLDLGEHGRTSRAAVLVGDFSYHVDLHGMYAVDLRDPSSPQLAGYFGHPPGFPGDFTYNLHALTVADHTAYMVGQRGDFWTSDLSDPAAPGGGGFVSLPDVGTPAAIAVKGRHAYVLVENDYATKTSLIAIDLDGGGPDSPLQTASVMLDDHGFLMVFWPRSMAIHQDRLYVAGGTSDLVVLSIEDPATPVELGRIVMDQAPRHVVLSYPFALVSDSYSVRVIDVSDPTSMYEIEVADEYAYKTAGVVLSGDLLFVNDGADLSLHRFGGCTDPILCIDECERGARRCEGNAAQTCETQADACTDWSEPEDCGEAASCVLGECRCFDLCSPGSGLCTDTPGYQTCELQPSGCYDWAEEVGCDVGWTCSDGRCVHGCIDQCAPGERWCDGTTGYQSCELMPDGCYDWSATTGCEDVHVCRDGLCLLAGCVDGTITPGPETCNGTDDDCDGLIDEPEITRLSDMFFSGSHNDLAVQDDKLYVADAYGLLIYDLSQPDKPLVGRSPMPGVARSVALSAEYAYVGVSGAVNVVDLRYPPWYTVIESIPTREQTYFSLDVAGGYLVIGYTDRTSMLGIYTGPLPAGIDVYDVSTPTEPVLLGALDFEEDALVHDVAISGEFAYAAADDGLHVVHLSDPAGPTEVGRVTADPLLRIAASGSFAYATGSLGELTVIDLTDPTNPATGGELDLLGHEAPVSFAHASIVISGNRGVVTLDDSLVVLDLDHPQQPKVIGRLAENVCGGSVVLDGDRAYALSGLFGIVLDPRSIFCSNALLTIDVENPELPSLVERRENDLRIETFGTDGSIAIAVDRFQHLHVLDMNDPAAPVELTTLPPRDTVQDVLIEGGHAYLAEGDGFRILDMADPAAPTEKGYYSPYMGSFPYFYEPTIDGDTAYLASAFDGTLWILDISDLGEPNLASVFGTFPHHWAIRSLTVRDDYVFMLAFVPPVRDFKPIELIVVDATDRAAPVEVARVPLWTSSLYNSDIAIHGDRLYVADKVFLAVFDISDPTSPVELGRVQTGFPEAIALRFPYAVLAFGGGLQVYDVSDPQNIELVPVAPEVTTGAVDLQIADDLLMVNGGAILEIFELGGCL